MTQVHEARSFVAGAYVEDATGELHVNANPADPSRPVSSFRYVDGAVVEVAVRAGDEARAGWRALPIHDRAAIVARAADVVDRRAEELARALAQEQGKILAVCRGEVARASALLRYFAHEANAPTGSMYASPRAGERIFTDRVPVGQVLCITPWNVPYAIPAWKIGPALVHGNTVLWKPSEVVPMISQLLLEAFVEAGVPDGVLNLVHSRPDETEAALRDPRVAACTFTGSTPVGQHLRRVGAESGTEVLAEMGGKNAAIVLADADLPWAAEQVASAAMGWSGQRCTATSRVIVQAEVLEEFTALLREKAVAMTAGDPLDPASGLGPVTTGRQYDTIRSALADAVASGADLVTGSVPAAPEGGYFIEPTVVRGVGHESRLFQDELFGPVAVVVPAADLAEALELANEGPYGLAGSLFTRDVGAIFSALDGFDIGVIHVNAESCGADPHVPFGGFKDSGTSHKEMGEQARDFFTRTRTVYLRGGAA